MKRLLLILGLILIVGTLSAQNEYKYLLKAYGGLQVGLDGTGIGSTKVVNPNSKIGHIDSIRFNSLTTPTDYAIIHAGDTLNPVFKSSGVGSIFDYAVKLVPDTVHVTDPTYTVLAANASKIHVFYNDFTLVTIAAYATQPIPVGTFTTFISMGGKVRFTGTNVHSELDSLTINLRGAAQLWKQGQNDNEMIGSLLN